MISEQLLSSTGWIIAFLLLVLLLFRDTIVRSLVIPATRISRQVYNRLAGTPLLRSFALRRYRQALIDTHQQLYIPFRPNRPLKLRDVYVPLKVAGTSSMSQVDAYYAITTRRRLVIKGSPGAGKSMLLKHIMLGYAEGRWFNMPTRMTPILLELHRLNEPGHSLEAHLVRELARKDFPHAQRFVEASLQRGNLMLLLDGLDEVNSSQRSQVLQEIRALLERYPDCPVVITCRTVVYNSELFDVINQELEITEFNNQQIRQFLRSWEFDMLAAGKSVEQLLKTLSDRPPVLALARNPLLLTIIAYLYTDTSFVWSRSRAEFYLKATDILLDQWHQERNRFEARTKRLILQSLALFSKDRASNQAHESHTIEQDLVLQQISQVLPALNLQPDENAIPILQEIVERSGLLLSIDGGARYQFAHLTLQDFFAAMELLDDPESLVTRFRADRDIWRETVKLWCGLARDSTELVQSIYIYDPFTAFECLVDAQQVDKDLAVRIIKAFGFKLGSSGKEDTVVRAFGAFASDLRPRGAAVFKFLEKSLLSPDSSRRIEAAIALSLTNLPQAARVLAAHYSTLPEIRAPLVRMGDLAVPVIASLAASGNGAALDDLYAIGTAHAAEVLARLLWHTDETMACNAAWRLAALLPDEEVEARMRSYALTIRQRQAPYLSDAWQPFEQGEPANSSLPIVAGRIAYLIEHAPVDFASVQFTLDPRLVIPRMFREVADWSSSEWRHRNGQQLEEESRMMNREHTQ